MIKNILKWQGGKADLFYGEIKQYLPDALFDPSCDITFIDAFAGGGSVFLYVLNNCPGVKRLLINDYNYRVIDLYRAIQTDVKELIKQANELQDGYNSASDKSKYYYDTRAVYNRLDSWNYISRAAYTLFINRASYNGIYRENSLGEFNVPWCKKDVINTVKEEDLIEANTLLNSGVQIEFTYGDFEYSTERYVTYTYENGILKGNTFIYFDPPYRPLSTAGSISFTAYTKSPFNDDTQIRLRDYCNRLRSRYDAGIMVSNSYDANDSFIQDIYKDYNIYQVNALRSSGGKNAMRGTIKENLIISYKK